jgi:hypothetical protein
MDAAFRRVESGKNGAGMPLGLPARCRVAYNEMRLNKAVNRLPLLFLLSVFPLF